MRNIITAEELRELEACEGGYVTFVKKNGSEATYLEALESNGIGDLLWYFDHTGNLSKEQRTDLQKLINGYALVNIELIKPYIQEYDVIVSFLQGDESKREAAETAAWAAWAARAAWGAPWAALAARAAWGAARTAEWAETAGAVRAVRAAARAAETAGAAGTAWAAARTAAARTAAGAAAAEAAATWAAATGAAREEQTKQLKTMLIKWEKEDEK